MEINYIMYNNDSFFIASRIKFKIGYGRGSLFASSLYLAKVCPRLCLLGSTLEEEMEIRGWIEFYCSQLRPPFPWQCTSKERLHSCIEVSGQTLSISHAWNFFEEE